MSSASALMFARAHRDRFLAELKSFVRIPSVSAEPVHAGDIRRCASWLARHLEQIGMARVRIIPTPRHPIVQAAWRKAPGRPTVLVYGHYDVQPAESVSAWRTPPFEPTVVGNDLFGRGACDDKGQLFCHVKAIEAYLATGRALPVNVVCLFEGEEEIGSPHLQEFLARHRRAIRADVAVMSDTRILGPDHPALTYALRGGLAFELDVHGPAHDLHSGNFGGAVHNPLQALCELVARLHDASGRVAVPGFYDQVRAVGPEERAAMARAGPTEASLLRNAGVRAGWGERGYSALERTTIRPALTINGLAGGYQGTGGKAVIPARATAKLSVRLVPDQDPYTIKRLIRAHLSRIAPPTVQITVRFHSAARPALIDRRHPAMRAAAIAYARAFGAKPVYLRSGGTIPVVDMLRSLEIPTVLMGFALPDDRMHGPNEKFHLPNFRRGIEACIHFLAEVASTTAPRVLLVGERPR
jgi:acetylornithine deacetylase/succinyl-diaminopimelate desuccinylase-like protein